MALTDNSCRTAPLGKTFDGGGLCLNVKPRKPGKSGKSETSRLWQMAYRFGGKQKTLSFGPYPVVTLAAARAARDEAKAHLAAGVDPMTIRKGSPRIAAVPVERQFATIAWRWFDNNSDSWRTKYRDQVRSQLARLVVPTLAKRDIASITAPEVLAVLRAAEASSGRPTTRRCRQFFGCIFGLAVAEGLCQGDPSATLNKALKGRVDSKPRPRVAPQDIPALLLDISRYPKESIRLGLMLALHTGLRPGEVRKGRWKQIHDGKWRISADDMKMKKPHVVTLSPQARAILARLKELAGGSDYILPAGPKATVNPEIGSNILNEALKKMGYEGEQCVHGFRSLFSTATHDNGWRHEWVEMQLAHSQKGVAGRYNDAEYSDDRARMMLWWSDKLDALLAEAEKAEVDELLAP